MEPTVAVNPWVAVAYLASGVLFILALRGLSSPATSRSGNRFGMIGMLIAVATTLVTHVPSFPVNAGTCLDLASGDAAAGGRFQTEFAERDGGAAFVRDAAVAALLFLAIFPACWLQHD